MNSEQIRDWLTELDSYSDGDLSLQKSASDAGSIARFVNRHGQSIRACMDYILSMDYTQEALADNILDLLLVLYNRREAFRIMALQFVPSLIEAYLVLRSRPAGRDAAAGALIETFLLAVYNEEIVNNSSSSTSSEVPSAAAAFRRVETVRVPSMRQPSIYHEPAKIAQSILADAGLLSRLSPPSSTHAHSETLAASHALVAAAGGFAVQIGPYPPAETMIGENRFMVLNRLVRSVCEHVSQMHLSVSRSLCHLSVTVARSGFHFMDSDLSSRVLGRAKFNLSSKQEEETLPKQVFQKLDDYSGRPRITLNSSLLLELLNCVYFALFNGAAEEALPALDAVHQRSRFEMFPDVMLVSRAIINSLLAQRSADSRRDEPLAVQYGWQVVSPSVRATEGSPPGVSAPPPPQRGHRPRSLLTSASLRVKRMPEDIDVRPASQAMLPNGMPTVRSEEGQQQQQQSSIKKRLEALKAELGRGGNKDDGEHSRSSVGKKHTAGHQRTHKNDPPAPTTANVLASVDEVSNDGPSTPPTTKTTCNNGNLVNNSVAELTDALVESLVEMPAAEQQQQTSTPSLRQPPPKVIVDSARSSVKFRHMDSGSEND